MSTNSNPNKADDSSSEDDLSLLWKKRRRSMAKKHLSLEERIGVLKCLDNGMQINSVAEKFRIDRKSVRTIKKNREVVPSVVLGSKYNRIANWKFYSKSIGSRQTDNFTCGVHVILLADYLSNEREHVLYGPDDIIPFRSKLLDLFRDCHDNKAPLQGQLLHWKPRESTVFCDSSLVSDLTF